MTLNCEWKNSISLRKRFGAKRNFPKCKYLRQLRKGMAINTLSKIDFEAFFRLISQLNETGIPVPSKVRSDRIPDTNTASVGN